MGEFDLDNYQLYQNLLSSEAHLGSGAQEGPAAAIFQPPPPPPPQSTMLEHWAIDPPSYVAADGAFSVLPQQIPGGGVWTGNDDGFVPGGTGDWPGSGHGVPQCEAWAAATVESMMPGGDALPGNDQMMHGGGVPSLQDLLMGGVDLSEFMSDAAALNSLWASALMNSMAANQAAAGPSGATNYAPPSMFPRAEPNQPASDPSGPSTQDTAAASSQSPGMTSQMPAYPSTMDYPQAASVNVPQAVPDEEESEVAQMVRVAARCGDAKESTVWSEEENQVLRDGLSRFAGQDNVTKCFSIASGLANKTVLDVAYRIRWLSDLEKKRTAKQAQLEQEKTAEAKVTKVKGTKSANRKNNKYPLSKEVLDSKSAKDLIRDNDRLMDKIEEILRTGQVNNSPDYFYYVKMNMDVLLNKVTDVATVMEGLSVDDEEWEDVLKDRSSSA